MILLDINLAKYSMHSVHFPQACSVMNITPLIDISTFRTYASHACQDMLNNWITYPLVGTKDCLHFLFRLVTLIKFDFFLKRCIFTFLAQLHSNCYNFIKNSVGTWWQSHISYVLVLFIQQHHWKEWKLLGLSLIWPNLFECSGFRHTYNTTDLLLMFAPPALRTEPTSDSVGKNVKIVLLLVCGMRNNFESFKRRSSANCTA